MASGVSAYATRDLSRKTWPDFERLFSQGGGWDFCWCMHFHRLRSLPKKQFRTRAEQGVRNHQEKRELVEKRRSHGILVYADGEPVGWCQYGPKDELPRIDNVRKYRGLAREEGVQRLWRITCFVVHKKHRRRGAASAALKAALEAIRKRGGGLVEAYPIALRPSAHLSRLPTGNHFGTVSMFRRQGFNVVAPFGSTSVLMRRTVRGPR